MQFNNSGFWIYTLPYY